LQQRYRAISHDLNIPMKISIFPRSWQRGSSTIEASETNLATFLHLTSHGKGKNHQRFIRHTSNNKIMSARMNPPEQLIPIHRRPRRTAKKKVSFSNDSQMFIVANLRGDIEQRNKCWYSVDEIHSLKADMKCSIVRTRIDFSRRSFSMGTLVGFEKHLSADLAREYHQRKRTLFLAIHIEQRLQKSLNIPNPDRLATVALLHSQWARERACAAALLLEMDVFFSSPSADDAKL
jgi:hypothetical protein